ncbi:MAG: PfkB family carbohydrate kinase [Treponema sp.]|jgi:1-phosphofructokinase/tagatose 6-phosphate kinase|nr:PfkB family carbohydrate kinase [Treponema sp.]
MDVFSFLTVCMNPALQKTLRFASIQPNQVNRTGDYRFDVAGKGVNVCRVLTQLGKKSLHLTQLGGYLRPLFLELCAGDGIAVKWVESKSAIRFCYTLIDGQKGNITELVEESEPVGEGTEKRLLKAYSEALSAGPGTVIISGTMAAGFSDTLIPAMVFRAKKRGRRVILDIRGRDLLNSLPLGPDIIKPNLLEFAETFIPGMVQGGKLRGEEEEIREQVRGVCRSLCEKYHTRIVLTRGVQPVWFTEGESFGEFPFEPLEPVNTTGSGDAFTAGLASVLSEGGTLEEALAEGVRCGRLNAGLVKIGAIR